MQLLYSVKIVINYILKINTLHIYLLAIERMREYPHLMHITIFIRLKSKFSMYLRRRMSMFMKFRLIKITKFGKCQNDLLNLVNYSKTCIINSQPIPYHSYQMSGY